MTDRGKIFHAWSVDHIKPQYIIFITRVLFYSSLPTVIVFDPSWSANAHIMAKWSQSVWIEQWTRPMLKHHGFPIFTDGSDNLGFPMSFPNSKLNPNSIGVQQPEYSFPLLVTTIKNVNLPAQESEKDWNFKHGIILSHKNALFSWIQKSLVSINWAG